MWRARRAACPAAARSLQSDRLSARLSCARAISLLPLAAVWVPPCRRLHTCFISLSPAYLTDAACCDARQWLGWGQAEAAQRAGGGVPGPQRRQRRPPCARKEWQERNSDSRKLILAAFILR